MVPVDTKTAFPIPVREPMNDSNEFVGSSSEKTSSPRAVALLRMEESMDPLGRVTVSPTSQVLV